MAENVRHSCRGQSLLLIRDGIAEQQTTDHTLARQMVEAGGMKPEEESTSRWSNVLWNVLGGTAEAELSAEVRRG